MEILILVVLAAGLWFLMRSNAAPNAAGPVDLPTEAVRVGCGCPLALMVVMAGIVMLIMLGTMATGGCDKNARAGYPGDCMDTSFRTFEDAFGMKHYESMGDWWADPVNPFH